MSIKEHPKWNGVPTLANESNTEYMRFVRMYLPDSKLLLVHDAKWSYQWVYKAMWQTMLVILDETDGHL